MYWEIDNLSWTSVELDIYCKRQTDIGHRFYRKMRLLIENASTKKILTIYRQVAKMK